MTKSEIFSMYNKARAAARKGKLEAKRVNRALGILQTKQHDQKYNTTINSCNCEDHKRHAVPCKHMVAKMIEVKVERAKANENQTAKVQLQLQNVKVLYIELDWNGVDPWNTNINFQHASNISISDGSGLQTISAIDLVDILQGYKFIKADYLKHVVQANRFRMWWEKK